MVNETIAHKLVSRGVLKTYKSISKSIDISTGYPYLNKLCVRKVSTFLFPYF